MSVSSGAFALSCAPLWESPPKSAFYTGARTGQQARTLNVQAILVPNGDPSVHPPELHSPALPLAQPITVDADAVPQGTTILWVSVNPSDALEECSLAEVRDLESRAHVVIEGSRATVELSPGCIVQSAVGVAGLTAALTAETLAAVRRAWTP